MIRENFEGLFNSIEVSCFFLFPYDILNISSLYMNLKQTAGVGNNNKQ